MSIRFQCDRCGHPFEVDDRLGGKRGRCKHCGHVLPIPEHSESEPEAPLRLRPLEGDEPPDPAAHLLAAPAPLTVRPAEAEPAPRPAAISDPDDAPPTRRRRPGDYSVLDPHRVTEHHSAAGPPPTWWLLPSLTARFAARQFRTLRDWLYVASVGSLVVVLLGYLFEWKVLLHLGAAGVIASNVGMLGAGVAYLVTLPFKESFLHGLANLVVPFYAIYYWSTRWHRMRTPVLKTLASFTPILLVGLAYLVYKEAPVVEKAIEREVPALERAIERKAPALERTVDKVLRPLEEPAGPASGPPADRPEPPPPPSRSIAPF